MKKKVFIQLHPIWIFIEIFYLLCFIVWIRHILIDPLMNTIVWNKNRPLWIREKWITLPIWYLGLPYLFFEVLAISLHRIEFDKKFIFAPSEIRTKANRRQFKVKVEYDEIVDIDFQRSTKSSKNTKISEESRRAFYHHYLVLKTRNGKTERILLDYFTKKQKYKILEELNNRLKNCENGLDLEKAKKSLENLGMFGVVGIINLSENKKKRKNEKKDIK